jgi:O-antigen ligase
MMITTSLRPVRTVLAGTHPAGYLLVGAALLAATIVAAYVSLAGFAVLTGLLLLTIGAASARWPRAMLVLVVLAPLLDRFLIARVMPEQVRGVTEFFSESLLLVNGEVLIVQGWRAGRIGVALRHPASIALAAFVAVAVVSALLNAVPPAIAAIGLVYTVDAVALFYLCRLVGYDHGQAVRSIGAVAAAVALLALVGIAQGLLDPNLFGLAVVTGRSGESVRIGSLVRDPNVLGTLIGLALPFALFGAMRLQRPRWRWALGVAALLVMVALLLTYSRGAWLGVVAGGGIVMLLLDRRVIAFTAATAIVALGIATFMPRSLIVDRSASGANEPPPQFNGFDTTIERFGAVGEGRDLRTLFVINALPILRDHPLVGVGPGRYGGGAAYTFKTPVYDEYDTWKLLTAQRTVDNFWLHILVETGVLGALAFIGVIGAVAVGLFRAALRTTRSRYVIAAGILAGIATVSVSTGTTMLLEGNTVAFMFWFLLGIGSLYRPADAAAPAVASAER